ncbi:A24 family peptidase [Streptomyces sp. NPDC050448]|uniref:A24 family peptidase n=1 Tax=Streptomyces sp. NPDC050448 TaxID=3155404 RepID=UPI00341A497E
MGLVVIVLAAVAYGGAAGLLLPRAAYRLAVEPGAAWRDRCPEGHPIRGWLGLPRCHPAALAPPAPEPGGRTPGPAPEAPAGPDRAGGAEPGRAAAAGGRAAARRKAGLLGPGRAEGAARREAGGFPPGRAGRWHRYGVGPGWTAGLGGVVCGGLGWAVGGRPEAVVLVGVAPVLVLLGMVDLGVQRLPDVLTLPLAGGVAVGLGGAALVPGAGGSWRLALLGGAALGAAYLVLFLINPAGMGFGDVKLALALGVPLGWYGWGVWAAGAFLGFLYGALYGLALVLRGPGGRRTAFPFGPFMAAGALTGVLLGGFGA